MVRRYVSPSITLKSFNCPRCGALADQKWFAVWSDPVSDSKVPTIATHELVANFRARGQQQHEPIPRTIIEKWERAADGDVFLESRERANYCGYIFNNLHVSLCYSCTAISLWKHDTVLFPKDRYEVEPNQDMDYDIRTDFDEARSILDIYPRGAAALLRLCVQKLCRQLGKPGKNINDDIASFVKDGLDTDVQRALDIVRVIGNDAVHPGQLDLKDDRETATTLFELVNFIAEDRLSRPKKVAALYATLPAAKIAQITQRDQTKP